jgi:hypothetical protein
MLCRYWLCNVGYVHCALGRSVAYGIIAKLQTLILAKGLVPRERKSANGNRESQIYSYCTTTAVTTYTRH